MARAFLRDRRWQLGLALVALAIGWTARRAMLGPQVPTYQVARQDLVARVVASGQVMPPARITLAALWLAQVADVLVEEGDRVRAGQLLVQLDDAEPRAGVAQARAAVAVAAARLDGLRGVTARQAAAALRQAEVRLAQAETRLRRAEQLDAGGASSPQDLEDARHARDLARSARESAAALARATEDAGSELRQAAAGLEQARAQLAQAEKRLAQARLVAPAPAIVLSRAVEPGDVVTAGKPLVVLSRLGDTRLTVQPDEKNLALLRVGQPALAVADAFPDQAFPAEVSLIAPSVDPARGTVEVRLRVPDPPDFLRADMTVSVNVDVARKTGVLVAPADAVRDPNGDAWVMLVRDGRTERRPVTLGLRGEGMVEVVRGLAEGDEVVPTSVQALTPGQRVRARLARPVELAHAS